MEYLNQQIAALAKKKTTNLVRPQISCGIFQELPMDAKGEPKTEQKD